jgi:hypothetical protein
MPWCEISYVENLMWLTLKWLKRNTICCHWDNLKKKSMTSQYASNLHQLPTFYFLYSMTYRLSKWYTFCFALKYGYAAKHIMYIYVWWHDTTIFCPHCLWYTQKTCTILIVHAHDAFTWFCCISLHRTISEFSRQTKEITSQVTIIVVAIQQ